MKFVNLDAPGVIWRHIMLAKHSGDDKVMTCMGGPKKPSFAQVAFRAERQNMQN
jgi:hypothetical protein